MSQQGESPLIPNIDVKTLCFIILKHDLLFFFTPNHILMRSGREWSSQYALRCPGQTPQNYVRGISKAGSRVTWQIPPLVRPGSCDPAGKHRQPLPDAANETNTLLSGSIPATSKMQPKLIYPLPDIKIFFWALLVKGKMHACLGPHRPLSQVAQRSKVSCVAYASDISTLADTVVELGPAQSDLQDIVTFPAKVEWGRIRTCRKGDAGCPSSQRLAQPVEPSVRGKRSVHSA